ncbi:CD225/dispanin family protein [Streptomonospora sp. S1-112]|uniref:CD225/dispanin family protein n=1 Tax=Streptomonospora mangrovi TaxID=2883123 RepID=A0A9X3NRI4_9ACTN|nr:CD225/dispanin family protein [Streptomonospora mangrovi]MDA0568007.1 CD225/dispanin family protein [Streptomonospora mangrovi]
MSYGPPPGPPPSQPPGGGYGPPPGGSGGYPSAAGGGEPPNNFLVPAILAMFCCWPLAIPAILAAAKVNAQWNLGDYAGAQEEAAKAKRFTLIGVIIGVIVYVIGGISYFAIIAAAMSSVSTY